MEKIRLSEIKNLVEYEKVRNQFRTKIIQLKNDRRVKVGDRITLTFENRYTVVFQIEEMMRAERLVEEEKIQQEVDVYNELIPGPNELSATLFVEVDDPADIKPVLDSLVGLNRNCVFLQLGERMIPAVFEEGHATESRISAVQYVRFLLKDEEVRGIADLNVPMRIIIRHRNYNADVAVSENVRRAIYYDITGGATANVWESL
ncbi:MAG: DUF3501 family protein [Bacteroidota bacterium]